LVILSFSAKRQARAEHEACANNNHWRICTAAHRPIVCMQFKPSLQLFPLCMDHCLQGQELNTHNDYLCACKNLPLSPLHAAQRCSTYLFAGAGVDHAHHKLLCWLLAARELQALCLCCVAWPCPALRVGEAPGDVWQVEEGVDAPGVAVII
jgi:hypothetical protein